MTSVTAIDYTQITVDQQGPVAVITLHRPERLNAWTPLMAEEQVHAIRAANDDPSVGAIVMTGSGRGFCAGADMEATFQTRIGGTDPGNDTAGGVGGMPAGLDWVTFLRSSKPIGLANRLTEPDELLVTAIGVANSYAANPDLQLRMTKQLLTENVVDTDLRAIQHREQVLLAECWKSAEHKEAVSAFLEKRPPVFRQSSAATAEHG